MKVNYRKAKNETLKSNKSLKVFCDDRSSERNW